MCVHGGDTVETGDAWALKSTNPAINFGYLRPDNGKYCG